MHGDWTVQIENGRHAVHVEIAKGFPTYKLRIAWDGALIESSPVLTVLGDLKSFQHDGHSFQVSVHGLGMLGSLMLSMDGFEVPRAGAAPVKTTAAATLQFVKEINVHDSEEIIGTEQYPLDNRFGDQPFTTVREVSRESTNELSIDTGSRLGGKVGFEVLSAIKAEMETQVSQQMGQKIGEKVTERQTLTFSVGPKSSVIYEVVWMRKIRSGERLYLTGGNIITIPYRLNYGLSCEVRTREQANNN